jgi:hypothetical protein
MSHLENVHWNTHLLVVAILGHHGDEFIYRLRSNHHVFFDHWLHGYMRCIRLW